MPGKITCPVRAVGYNGMTCAVDNEMPDGIKCVYGVQTLYHNIYLSETQWRNLTEGIADNILLLHMVSTSM